MSNALREASPERRVRWLAAASELLLADAVDARETLAETTGLSASMVDWAVQSTLETFTPDALRAVFDDAMRAGRDPIDSLAVVLAGNVFTAGARAVMVPLLLGIPVAVKASSRETTFPALLRNALQTADDELGSAMKLRTFVGGNLEEEGSLFAGSEVAAVYGSDETVAAIRGRHHDLPLVAHGHGVSIGFCELRSMDGQKLDLAANRLALDVCAYDQRGCLSPQVIYVVESDETRVSSFVAALDRQMRVLGKRLPRGPLPLEVGAVQAQWRGLAEVEGELLTGEDYAIAVRPSRPIRWSPGHRNVTVSVVDSVARLVDEVRPLGEHLKCVGADRASIDAVQAGLDATPELSAYVSPLGTMQTPALDAPADGHPIWHGLVR